VAIIGGYLLVFSVLTSAAPPPQEFSGDWVWFMAPNSRAFSIKLRQTGRDVSGQYCAIVQNGNRIDCDDEENPNMYGVANSSGTDAIVEFSSFFGATKGKSQLKIVNGQLIWHVERAPSGGLTTHPQMQSSCVVSNVGIETHRSIVECVKPRPPARTSALKPKVSGPGSACSSMRA